VTASALAAPPECARLPSEARERRLDEVIDSLWDRLIGHRPAECPVCGGEMHPEYGAGARPVGGRCGSCRSRLT
jgi:hypothetical protein